MSKYPLFKKCSYCSNEYPCYKKQQYIKRVYCSTDCMYKSPEYRANQKKSMAGGPGSGNWAKNPEVHKKALELAKKALIKKYGKWEDRKVKIGSHILNITNGELEIYRQKQLVCEICGKNERVSTTPSGKISRLATDHNHTTMVFRGLLCCDCNRKLGWYENLSDQVNKYLNKKYPNL